MCRRRRCRVLWQQEEIFSKHFALFYEIYPGDRSWMECIKMVERNSTNVSVLRCFIDL